MLKCIMLNVTILLVITLQLVQTASHLHSYENEKEKRDLLEELEQLVNEHRNRTKTCGPSVSLEKLQLLKEKMEDMSALMDEIYKEAESEQGSEDSSIILPTQPEDTTVYADCTQVYNSGHKESGVYRIINSNTRAYCYMDIDQGGWTVFQRRSDGSVDFNRTWAEYRDGFGDVNGEYWLGLELLHKLTAKQPMELYILLEEFDESLSYARYEEFKVDSEPARYKLHVSKYTGNAGDGLRYHNKMEFSTKDRDNDDNSSGSCSKERTGAWWYVNCMMSNLNGKYQPSARADAPYGFSWQKLKSTYQYFLKGSIMMTRPSGK